MKSKIKTMKSRQEVSDEEIHRYMNFDNLLLQKDKYIARQKSIRVLRNIGITLTGIAVLIVFTLLISNRELAGPADRQSSVRDLPAQQPQSPKITTQDSTNSEDQIASETAQEKERKKTTSPQVKPKVLKPAEAQAGDETDQRDEHETAEAVYKQAEPVNGYPDLYAYFDRELIYPKEALKDSIQGIVTIVFSINAAGQPGDIQIENSLGKAFDREVLRVIGKMPAWNAASYNGKPVKSKVSLPLTFQLKKLNTQ